MEFNICYSFLRSSSHLHSSMHSMTRMDSKDQVDYSRVSKSVDEWGSSAEEFDMDYFTPHRSSVKATKYSISWAREWWQNATPCVWSARSVHSSRAELVISYSAFFIFEANFLIVVRVPSSSQFAMMMPSVIVAAIPSTTPPTTTILLVGGEDLLKFSFEGASGVGGASGNGSPSVFTPFGLSP